MQKAQWVTGVFSAVRLLWRSHFFVITSILFALPRAAGSPPLARPVSDAEIFFVFINYFFVADFPPLYFVFRGWQINIQKVKDADGKAFFTKNHFLFYFACDLSWPQFLGENGVWYRVAGFGGLCIRWSFSFSSSWYNWIKVRRRLGWPPYGRETRFCVAFIVNEFAAVNLISRRRGYCVFWMMNPFDYR